MATPVPEAGLIAWLGRGISVSATAVGSTGLLCQKREERDLELVDHLIAGRSTPKMGGVHPMSSEENFVEEVPEDYFALEEMLYPETSKCRKKGAKKRDKFDVRQEG